jgi:hypothetical protein
MEYDIAKRVAGGSRWKIAKVGIGKATTFSGFCARHDSETFAPIDTRTYSGSEEETFLHGYRAFCREYHAKASAEANQKIALQMAGRGLPLSQQEARFREARAFYSGVEEAMHNFRNQKTEWDRMLTSGDYSRLDYRVFRFNCVPDVMCSGTFDFEVDFLGRHIQTIAAGPLFRTTFSIFADGDSGGVAVLAWLNGNCIAEEFADSVDAVSDHRVAAAMLRLAFTMIENHAFRISWWNALPPTQQHLVEKWADSGMGGERRADSTLVDQGEQLVSWPLRERLRKT